MSEEETVEEELASLTWNFPVWRVSKRPFDWAFDYADLPVEPRPTSFPEQARRWLYLRVPSLPMAQLRIPYGVKIGDAVTATGFTTVGVKRMLEAIE